MNHQPPDTPFIVYLDDPPHCGVSDRLERQIKVRFAVVLIGLSVTVGIIVRLLKGCNYSCDHV